MPGNQIPLIDFSSIAEGGLIDFCDEDFQLVAQEIGAAMNGIGMCNIINHGLDIKKIQNIYNVSTEFFNLPSQTKIRYRKLSPLKTYHGYSGPGDQIFTTNLTELRESWDICGMDAYDETKYPMEEIPEFKLAFDDLRSDLENLGKKILRCVELFLNFEKDFLISKHRNLGDHTIKSSTAMRSIYYYVLNRNDEVPENAIRFGEHKDFGTITLVIQDLVGGLEVKTSEDEWIEAVPVKDAILINSGVLLEYLTGGRFHAAPHRVRVVPESRMTKVPRQSFIYFVDPDGDSEIFPILPILPQKEVELGKYKNEVIVAYEHIQSLIEASTSNLPSVHMK